MPHKCIQCGREFGDGSTEILKGCPSCGGKKFLYIKNEDVHKDVLEEKSIKKLAEEKKEEIVELKTGKSDEKTEIYDRIESIRVVSPGSYELNIEKLAKGDDMIMQMGSDDKYIVDILSMAKKKKGRKKTK
ncbi:putative nucleic acid-binding Zn-ribbon protein [Methanomicrobium sp. W14]|uniref:Zn-ribbon domain-containing protein n=1 Tax=Methanomicrobium sp. W14 TaxID=2817839 RepID=UPI001AEB6670|nr:Zn-ribbon domain-containing protein [Methanomicrobium sp. W14]MBP2132091.1 putative nucleic acid-binding Zn-ribbon protein [Methanomicrobium sp. W14]